MPSLTQLLENPGLNLDVEPLGALSQQGPTVTGVVTVSAERRRGSMGEVLPGHLAVISSPNGACLDDEFIRGLADREAAGAVLAAGRHEPWQFTIRTRALAERLGIPLLTTTSPAHVWRRAGVWIMQRRAEEAEQHLSLLGGLIDRLPLHLITDTKAMQRLAQGLADALPDGQVLVTDSARGVLAAAPQSAPGVLAGAIIRQVAGTTERPSLTSPDMHTRVIPLDPRNGADPVLAVASSASFSTDESALVKRAAALLGLVDQAQRENGTVGEGAREVRHAAFQLLMVGEVVNAKRVLAPLNPHVFESDEARVYVIGARSPAQRDATARQCESVTAGRALVVRCPAEAHHVIIVEPMPQRLDVHNDDFATTLRQLVRSLPGHCMGGSRWQPLAAVAAAHEEAVTALSVAAHRADPVVLELFRSQLIEALDPVGAHRWASGLLAPIRALNRVQREEVERILPPALKYPYTHAARTLGMSRNTLALRMGEVAGRLGLDFTRTQDRALLGLAVDISTEIPEPGNDTARTSGSAAEVTLAELLENPDVRAWGTALLEPLKDDRRDLIMTLQTWLECDGHEETARVLGVSEATVSSHLRAIASATERDLQRLSEVRELAFALYAATGRPQWDLLHKRLRG